jgi:hypothetical protein
VLADQVVSSDGGIDESVSDEFEVVVDQWLNENFAGAIYDDELRIELLSKGAVIEIVYYLDSSDDLIVPFDEIFLLRVLSF